jgi:hypothetical protein
MNDRIRRLYEMFSRVLNFMTANAADFQAIPFVAATVAELNTEAAKISALAADKTQFTAASKDSTIFRGDARDALRDAMDDIVDVWKSASTSNNDAQNKFRMPRGSDQNIIAAAKAFATEAETNKQIFIERGMPDDFIVDLRAKSSAFETAVNAAESVRGVRVGTNAAFDEPTQKCQKLVSDLEPAVKRTYRSNPQKMAEWTVARHVERAAKAGKQTTPTAVENQ